MVERLLKVKDIQIDIKNSSDWTPLHAAAWSGKLDVVKLLVRKEANVMALDNIGDSMLMKALVVYTE